MDTFIRHQNLPSRILSLLLLFFFTTNKIILPPFLDNIIISFNLLIPLFIPSTLLGTFPEDACYTPREIYKI